MREQIRDNSIDLIFTDPPYGIEGGSLDTHYNRKKDKIISGYVDVPKNEYKEFSLNWITECERVLKPGGSIYVVSGYTNLIDILNALHSTHLKEVNHLIAEYSFGVYTKNKWVSSHYHVLYWAKKGKRTFNTFSRYSETNNSYNDRLSVQKIKRQYRTEKIRYQNQLPETFIEKFMLYSSNEGDLILDPFAGSFSTGKVAIRLGRKFVGFELNKEAFDTFSVDLANMVNPGILDFTV